MDSKKIDRFADYFVICGLDLNSGLETDHFSEIQLQDVPLDRSYKSKVLSHYPDSVPWNIFDKDAIRMLSLPDGLRFRTQKHNIEPQFHSFIVTKRDGNRCYGFSYVFYEKVHNEICGAMQTLQAMYLTEVSDGHRKIASNCNTRSLPRHFKVMSHQFNSSNYYDITKDTLYVTKCIVLVTQYQYMHASYQFLSNLFKSWRDQTITSIETYVYYILNDVKVPSPGQNTNFYIHSNLTVTIRSPNLNELPLFDFAIREIFYILDVDSILYLFTSILLENQILIRSSNFQQLMMITETLNCLLFPFSWPHVYVPILPSALEHFLDAPVPFIMGLSPTSNVNISQEANLCFIDVETQTIQLPEDSINIPNKAEFASEIIDLLDQYNISTNNFYRQIKNNEMRLKFKRNDSMISKLGMSLSSENVNHMFSCPSNSFYDSNLYNNYESFRSMQSCSSYCYNMDSYVMDQCFNTAIRELFLNKFLHLFLDYENFIIHNQVQERWVNDCESVQNFDKTAFVANQPENFLFLSRFMETQMFANFIDSKIQSQWSKKENNLCVFDDKIALLKKRHADIAYKSCSLEYCSSITECHSLVKEQFSKTDIIIGPPEEIFVNTTIQSPDVFPLLNLPSISSVNESNKSSKKVQILTNSCNRTHKDKSSTNKQLNLNSNSSRLNPAIIAQTNWNFVDELLKDCKVRTKKMLVSKIGYEDIEFGPKMQNMLMEENALIIGLCDLLERIWSHGCQNKQGKSALWYYLMKYKDIEGVNDIQTRTDSMLHMYDSSCTLKNTIQFSQDEDVSVFVLERLPISLISDINYIQMLNEIKTPVGLAKAWIRLSLEKKLLSRHLKTILSNTILLKSMYKRYAFLRCDEEKEQFLYHLLSLNAVDYYCFTNNYPNAKILYRVLIHSSTKIVCTWNVNCWIIVSGSIGETEKILIPKGKLEFTFQYKNLGILTLIRIGQDNKSFSLKWLIDWIIVRNEITGHTYSFPCGRWLGRGVDDDSSERLLVGKRLTDSNDRGRNATATRIRSPSVPPAKKMITNTEIQHNLSECVNNIVKFYYGKSKETDSITRLLCDESGFVYHLEQMFLYGFKSTRLFGRNLYVWDFFIKVQEEKESSSKNEMKDDEINEVKYFCKLMHEVQKSSDSLGKEGRFQVFVCITIRDRTINSILKILSMSKAVTEMYEEYSFLRKKSLFYFLIHLLDPLYDLEIFLENCLTLGITID